MAAKTKSPTKHPTAHLGLEATALRASAPAKSEPTMRSLQGNRLMVDLALMFDTPLARAKGVARTVHGCCRRTGGMLTITKDRIQQINPQVFWFARRNNTLNSANVTLLSAGETALSLVA